MAKLVWDVAGTRTYETGVENGVLYLLNSGKYDKAVAWSGITSVSESPSGADTSDLYADNIKYLSLTAAETFGATIEAYTYPDEFAACDGTKDLVAGVSIGQQSRQKFGLAYKTKVGNDTDGDSYGYKLHLIYGATASPSDRQYSTTNDSPEAITFSWEINTIPVTFTYNSAKYSTATITIDSTKVSAAAMTAIEDALFGTDSKEAYLPLPDEVYSIISGATTTQSGSEG